MCLPHAPVTVAPIMAFYSRVSADHTSWAAGSEAEAEAMLERRCDDNVDARTDSGLLSGMGVRLRVTKRARLFLVCGLAIVLLLGVGALCYVASLARAIASLEQRLSAHQQVAYTRHNLHHNLQAGNALVPDTHDYPYARFAVATMISLTPSYCQVGYLLFTQLRQYDPDRQHDIVIMYLETDDTSLFQTDRYCSALHRLSLVPAARLHFPDGHSYSAGALRLKVAPSLQAAVRAKNISIRSSNWVVSLNKIEVFTYYEYDSILWLDGDALPIQPLHSFFALPFDLALGFDQYIGCGLRYEMMGGIFLFRPSHQLTDVVFSFLDPSRTIGCSGADLRKVDQSIFNCICGTDAVRGRQLAPDIHCGKLPWYTQIQPHLLYRDCEEFHPDEGLILHYGGAPKPWKGWSDVKICAPLAIDASSVCQPSSWFASSSCFTPQNAMFTYWHCQLNKQSRILDKYKDAEGDAWGQLMDVVAQPDPCPCTLVVRPSDSPERNESQRRQ